MGDHFFYIHQPIVNMRETPSFQSKVVSQALFSEPIQVKDKQGQWSYIASSDNYEGWIPSSTFETRTTPYEPNLQITRLSAHLYSIKDIEFGPMQTLPFNSRLQELEVVDSRWIKVALPNHQEGYIQKGDVFSLQEFNHKKNLIAFSHQFLGLPYTWGGRSSFGYDCSGFVQMLYQSIGVFLERDSCQQAIDPRFSTIDVNKLEGGDLIFFGTENKKIKHVGMHLEDGSFIHATARENKPWIRISHLTDFEWSGHEKAFYPYRIGRQLQLCKMVY